MIKKFFWYFIPFFIFTLLYILSFYLTPKFFFNIPLLGPVGVLLFLGILMIVILKLTINNFVPKDFDIKDIFIVALSFFFINYNIYGMIPFNTSRSNSILIVGYLLQNDMPKSKNDIENYVKKIYFDKYDAVQMRLNEQMRAGNIASINGKYYLTERGKFITRFFAYVTDIYNAEPNLAKPQ